MQITTHLHTFQLIRINFSIIINSEAETCILPGLLSINNYYYLRGGAEAVFLRHNSLFEKFGWQVAPFAMQHPNNLDTLWSEYFVEEIEYGSDYSLWEKFRRVPKVIYSFEARANIDRLLDQFQASICHAHNIYHHLSPSILERVSRRGIPLVMTLHDLKLACPAYNMLTHDGVCERCKGGYLYNVLRHRCIKGSTMLSTIVLAETLLHGFLRTFDKYVDRFVVPSRFYLDKLADWGLPSDRFIHIPNAIDIDAFVPDFTAGDSFLYFGRLSREKGLSTLIRAAALAGIPLQVAGSGPDEQALRELADTTGANVKFLGYLNNSSLHNVIRASRAIVLPSEWYENAPLALMEAYALGKPVIGAAIGGIPELIMEGETGATFDSGSADELASVLSRFSEYTDSRLSMMGLAGRNWMEKEFSMDLYGTRMLDLYRELGVQ